jgi:glutathione peroxidase
MKLRYIFSSIIFVFSAMISNLTAVKSKDLDIPDSIKNIVVKNMDGKDVKLSDYAGKVLLIVNVASNCGYTPQYQGLEAIYEKYKAKGFEILAFPCNDFGGQEPGSNEEIKNFCSVNYKVSFTLFDKIKVLGNDKSSLYKLLTNTPTVEQGDVKWNFEKFLIDKQGNITKRFRSKIKPESEELTKSIEIELNK